MRAIVVVSVIIGLAGCGTATVPESASPVTGLDTQLKRTRFVVLPRPIPETLEQDVDVATAQLEAAERREGLISEVVRPARRPDLDDSVTSGIQGRNLQRALTR